VQTDTSLLLSNHSCLCLITCLSFCQAGAPPMMPASHPPLAAPLIALEAAASNSDRPALQEISAELNRKGWHLKKSQERMKCLLAVLDGQPVTYIKKGEVVSLDRYIARRMRVRGPLHSSCFCSALARLTTWHFTRMTAALIWWPASALLLLHQTPTFTGPVGLWV